MLVQIILDQPQGQFTNLDVISGRVVLRLPNPTTVSHIVVKLEAESRTRLLAPPRPDTKDRPRPELEIHKLLYKIARVFPPPNVQIDPRGKQAFNLGPGEEIYPFAFKLPFNNACSVQTQQGASVTFGGFGVEFAKPPRQHVKTTLPPTIYIPGTAEIKYYVKVTVNRPSLLKENPRSIAPFAFVPIEPPRAKSNGEVYARRQHQFLDGAFPAPTRRPSLFKAAEPKSPTSPSSSPVRISVDARLPNPAILTCGQEVPLKVLFKQLSPRQEQLYLQNLQVQLVGHTKIRAQDVVRTENNSYMICSKSNLNHPIGSPSDPIDSEIEVTKEFWYGIPLPDSVSPSFVTCNISRFYELHIDLGLSYGHQGPGKDQFIMLPLRIETEVYSGIAPPPELLKRLTDPPESKPIAAIANSPAFNPPSPSSAANPSQLPAYGNIAGTQGVPQPVASAYEEAPPSYEEAMAQDLPPLNGPRPGYRPPVSNTNDPLLADAKVRDV